MRSGKVEERKLSHIHLDRGCSRTLIRQDLVPEEKMLEGKIVTVCSAHGDAEL